MPRGKTTATTQAEKAPSKSKTVTKKEHHVKRNYGSFRTYIERTLKQAHPDTGISKGAMSVVNAMVLWFGERVCDVVGTLLRSTKKSTVTSREIQTAVRLLLPGELAKHAVSEGTKAIVKFNAASSAAAGEKPAHGNTAEKAGIKFNPARFDRMLKTQVAGSPRSGRGAAIYFAAVVEYIVMEVLELSGNASKGLHVKRIIPRHLQLAVRGDEELDTLFKATIPHGGILPHIHKALFKKTKKKGGEGNQ